MVDDGHYGAAVVIAQAAVEVGVAMAVSYGLRATAVPDAVRTWIEGGAVRPWSPDNARVRNLWEALTGGDRFTERGLAEHRRRRAGHRGQMVG